MLQLLFTFINVFVLYLGIYALAIKLSAGNAGSVIKLTSAVVLLISLSFCYYLMLVSGQSFIALLIFLAVINLLHIFFTRNTIAILFRKSSSESVRPHGLWIAAAVFFLTIYFVLHGSKYGGWDAWAIWNLHAKFLYNPTIWKQLFCSELSFSHPDYPLMLPAMVAFFWKAIDHVSPFVPMVFSYLLLLAIPLLIIYSLIEEGLTLYAYLALVMFVADDNYKAMASTQTADCLLSLLILLVFICRNNIKRYTDNHVYLLGFICASCAWVKNEGLMFYLLFSVCYVLANLRNIPTLKKYVLGIIIPTIVIASFKFFYSPANDLVAANQKRSLSHLLFNADRFFTILKFGINTLNDSYIFLLILLMLVLAFNRRFFISLPFIVICLLLVVYFVVYLTTPYNLQWHLSTSMDRLIQHAYPALVYLIFISLKDMARITLLTFR